MLPLLLTLIFIRPFISSLAFPLINSIYLFALLVTLIVWIIAKGASWEKTKHLHPAMLILTVSLLVSFGFSSNKLLSILELSTYFIGFLILTIIPSLSSKEREQVIRCILFSGFVITLMAFYQYFFGFSHLEHYASAHNIKNPFVLDYLRRRRVFSPFVTPNALAGYLIMAIPLAFTNKKYSWYILPMGLVVILTQSLGAILSLFLAMVFYFYMLGKEQKRNTFILAGILLITVIVLCARLLTQGAQTQPIFSTVMRLRYWQDTFAMILRSPLIGTGMGNFNLNYSRFTHNSYLQFWAETGIVSLLALGWLVIVITKNGIVRAKNNMPQNMILALLTANLAFLLHNFIDFTFFLPEVTLAWWVILGLLI